MLKINCKTINLFLLCAVYNFTFLNCSGVQTLFACLHMFPKLESGVGKGTSGKSIHSFIFKHVPTMYLPVLRMVSKPFAECLKYIANTTIVHDKENQRKVLTDLIVANDLKVLSVYVETFKWDIFEMLDVAFEHKCSCELIFYLFEHEYGTGISDFQDSICMFDRRDVFEEMLRKNMNIECLSAVRISK